MTRPYRAESLHRPHAGVCSGIVEENEDPAKEGRVKVRFLWLDNRTVTEWCRVVQPYAGGGYGVIFVPEKQDEVLVSFVHGDMTEPVVLGGLYNGNDKPPGFRLEDTDKKVIRTKAGHELLFDDSKPSLGVTLKSKDGHVAKLDDKQQVLSVKSKGGHLVELDDRSKTVTLRHSGGKASIKIDATGNVTIEGSVITISGTQINIG
jgi:uncharacterized protein involved in type VI secretion and phage assembly